MGCDGFVFELYSIFACDITTIHIFVFLKKNIYNLLPSILIYGVQGLLVSGRPFLACDVALPRCLS